MKGRRVEWKEGMLASLEQLKTIFFFFSVANVNPSATLKWLSNEKILIPQKTMNCMMIQGIIWTQKETTCLETILKIQQHSTWEKAQKKKIAGQYLQDRALFFWLSFLAISTCQQPFALLSWAAGVKQPMCDLMKDTLPV